jgi:hypothetical protein
MPKYTLHLQVDPRGSALSINNSQTTFYNIMDKVYYTLHAKDKSH